MLQTVLTIVIARAVGPAGLGAFYLYFAWTQVGIAAGSGAIPQLLIRRTAVHLAVGEFATARGQWRRSLRQVLTRTVVVQIVLVGLAFLPANLRDAVPFAGVLWYVILGVVPYAVLLAAAEGLKALERPATGLFLQFAAGPMVTLTVVLLWALRGDLGAGQVLAINLVATAMAAGTAVASCEHLLSARSVSESTRQTTEAPAGDTRVANTFWLQGALTTLGANLPFVVLPLVLSRESVGVFGAAFRLVALASLVLMAIAGAYAPRIVAAWRAGDPRMLRQLLQQTQVFATATYVPAMVVFLLVAEPVLSVFGPEFGMAASALRLLAVAQLANAVTGTVGQFNLMTAGEMAELWAAAAALFVGLLAGVVLGRLWGGTGVAAGIGISIVIRNVWSWLRAVATIRRPVRAGVA